MKLDRSTGVGGMVAQARHALEAQFWEGWKRFRSQLEQGDVCAEEIEAAYEVARAEFDAWLEEHLPTVLADLEDELLEPTGITLH